MPRLFSFRTHSFLSLPERKERFRTAKKRKRTLKTGSASRAAFASEEASSIPFPPGRRKLHIRSLLPFQIVTVSLGHNLAIWNFTTPHAILMMADRRNFVDTVCRGGRPCPPGALHIRNAKPFGEIVLPYGPTESSAPTRQWIGRECSRFRTFSFFSSPGTAILFFLEEEKEKNGGASRADSVAHPYKGFQKIHGIATPVCALARNDASI